MSLRKINGASVPYLSSPLNRDAALLSLIIRHSSACILILEPSTKEIKAKLKQPFNLGIGNVPSERYHVRIRLSSGEGSATAWPPLPVTFPKVSPSPIIEDRNGKFCDGLYATYRNFPLPGRTRQRARVSCAADGIVYRTKYSLEISIKWIAAPLQSLRKANVLRFTPSVPDLAGVVISYTISAHDQQIPADFRQVKFTGYHCSLCLRPRAQADFENIVALRFHFATADPAHKVLLQGIKPHSHQQGPITYSILVPLAPQKEKIAARWKNWMSWIAPSVPFDAAAEV